MIPASCEPIPALSASALRQDVNARAAALQLPCEFTTGRSPSVLLASNGNLHPASRSAIHADPAWARRLDKAHTAYRRALPRANWRWRELDCACSSDALLMNVFCHPETLAGRWAVSLPALEPGGRPSFGVRVRVPLSNGRVDTTEVDMQLGSLLVEAKLTETGFQTARPALVNRYRDLVQVFDLDRLPRTVAVQVAEQWDEGLSTMIPVVRGEAGRFISYQLIRGTLAAHALGAGFCVLCDARRADLIEAWHRVQRAVHLTELRTRLLLLTWQELAAALPDELQAFLAVKYGILP